MSLSRFIALWLISGLLAVAYCEEICSYVRRKIREHKIYVTVQGKQVEVTINPACDTWSVLPTKCMVDFEVFYPLEVSSIDFCEFNNLDDGQHATAKKLADVQYCLENTTLKKVMMNRNLRGNWFDLGTAKNQGYVTVKYNEVRFRYDNEVVATGEYCISQIAPHLEDLKKMTADDFKSNVCAKLKEKTSVSACDEKETGDIVFVGLSKAVQTYPGSNTKSCYDIAVSNYEFGQPSKNNDTPLLNCQY
ncbi:hypothetical protein GQ42DRAFT_159293 [Ramicandelaber brevisporus]|nr:hypothetical protein GQ42DRAFT_159293 [Ramicandelaber brevisporus]